MILRRLGNKKKIAQDIIAHFPPHKIYIEPFFGCGGMFFNKPKAKYNIVNDLDSDVFNLFQVVMNQKEELEKAFYIMPIHSDLLDYWKKNKETEPIKKALRFLFLSNFGYMGAPNSLRFGCCDDKNVFYKHIEKTFELLEKVQFTNYDFRKVFKCASFSEEEKPTGFIYMDPPYIQTRNKVYSQHFSETDVVDLFDYSDSSGMKYAMSEFDHPFILDQAKQRGLNVIIIGERQNLKNRRTEILITNYTNRQPELF